MTLVTPAEPDGSLSVSSRIDSFDDYPETLFNYFTVISNFNYKNRLSSQFRLYMIQKIQFSLRQTPALAVFDFHDLSGLLIGGPQQSYLNDNSCDGVWEHMLTAINKGKLQQVGPKSIRDITTAMVHYRAVYVLILELKMEILAKRLGFDDAYVDVFNAHQDEITQKFPNLNVPNYQQRCRNQDDNRDQSPKPDISDLKNLICDWIIATRWFADYKPGWLQRFSNLLQDEDGEITSLYQDTAETRSKWAKGPDWYRCMHEMGAEPTAWKRLADANGVAQLCLTIDPDAMVPGVSVASVMRKSAVQMFATKHCGDGAGRSNCGSAAGEVDTLNELTQVQLSAIEAPIAITNFAATKTGFLGRRIVMLQPYWKKIPGLQSVELSTKRDIPGYYFRFRKGADVVRFSELLYRVFGFGSDMYNCKKHISNKSVFLPEGTNSHRHTLALALAEKLTAKFIMQTNAAAMHQVSMLLTWLDGVDGKLTPKKMVSFAKVDYQLPPGLRTKIATHGDYTAASAARIIPTEVGVKVFERLFGQPYGIRPMCDLPVNDWMEIREEITRTALTLDVQVYAAATNGGGG